MRKAKSAADCQSISSPFVSVITKTFSSGVSTDALVPSVQNAGVRSYGYHEEPSIYGRSRAAPRSTGDHRTQPYGPRAGATQTAASTAAASEEDSGHRSGGED